VVATFRRRLFILLDAISRVVVFADCGYETNIGDGEMAAVQHHGQLAWNQPRRWPARNSGRHDGRRNTIGC
jgi:hypothetical protein